MFRISALRDIFFPLNTNINVCNIFQACSMFLVRSGNCLRLKKRTSSASSRLTTKYTGSKSSELKGMFCQQTETGCFSLATLWPVSRRPFAFNEHSLTAQVFCSADLMKGRDSLGPSVITSYVRTCFDLRVVRHS